MITSILLAMAMVGGTGVIIGILLGIAGEKFEVEVDEKEVAVRGCLPGTIVVVVDFRDVMVWQRQSQREKLR